MSLSRLLGATMVAGAYGPGEDERDMHTHAPAGVRAQDSDERLLARRVQRLLAARGSAPLRVSARGRYRARLR